MQILTFVKLFNVSQLPARFLCLHPLSLHQSWRFRLNTDEPIHLRWSRIGADSSKFNARCSQTYVSEWPGQLENNTTLKPRWPHACSVMPLLCNIATGPWYSGNVTQYTKTVLDGLLPAFRKAAANKSAISEGKQTWAGSNAALRVRSTSGAGLPKHSTFDPQNNNASDWQTL